MNNPPGLFYSAIGFDVPLTRDDAYHFVGGAAFKGLIVGMVDREDVYPRYPLRHADKSRPQIWVQLTHLSTRTLGGLDIDIAS